MLNSSNNSKNFFQVYGDGTSYGFLNGDWASWDIRKIKNSEMYLRIGTANRKVRHDGDPSIKISSTTDEKIILEKSSNPYIRFREGTTNKAYIQWNSNGQLYLNNSETNSHMTVANDRIVIEGRYGNVQIGAMNAGHAHFATDRSNFWFQKQIQVNGDIIDYRNKNKVCYNRRRHIHRRCHF